MHNGQAKTHQGKLLAHITPRVDLTTFRGPISTFFLRERTRFFFTLVSKTSCFLKSASCFWPLTVLMYTCSEKPPPADSRRPTAEGFHAALNVRAYGDCFLVCPNRISCS
jgi:hypothetical protein